MNNRKLDIPEVQQIPQFMKILDDLSVGNNPYLVGSAGTGKTTIGEKIAYAIKGRAENDGQELPFTIVNCNQWTSPIDIKGGQTISGYKEGALIEAWRDGKVLILDEMPKLDANTAGLLNDALAKSAREDAIIFNGNNEPIKKHRNFGCIATGNVIGKGASGNYVGNNKQDASLLDRFSGCIYRIGFNETLERQLVYPAVVDICLTIRKSILKYEGKEAGDDDTEDIMTLRTMLNFERAYELEMKRETGMKDEFGKTYRKMPNGKTLKDSLYSYFIAMTKEKAEHIKTEINLEGFLNSYKSSGMKQAFIVEFKRRIG